ncbi:50S ribosomal protein L21 [Spirulina sp. CCNP1310]|uniref:50S ribosomal protein L21 n=1 Tax=Spirulina sp. CCNP1310 TaxID=3110249 RepID=UPI002B1F3EAE|nr:50S ribosomal protein L21 [Spirulina sp. CCNP1310]MEA5421191.1 50S ribosomal protein L21 [Spirulina sp. CCNP1310]
MTYAIIATGGKQLRVEPGRYYDIELLHNDEGEDLTLEQVLLINHEGEIHVGQPLVTGATIEATILRHYRGKKVIVYKMRPKKKTRKKRGHRQEITRLLVNSISLNGETLAAAEMATVAPVEVVEAEPAEV